MSEEQFAEEAKKEIEERNRRRRKKEVDDLKDILASVQGRRFLWRLIKETAIFHSCFDPNALNMANKEGRRDIGLWVMENIKKVSFSVLGQMEREADSDEKSDQEEIKRENKKKEQL